MYLALRPLCVVLSFSPWENERERAQRKVHFFSCFWLTAIIFESTLFIFYDNAYRFLFRLT